jgi:hypothetical protein
VFGDENLSQEEKSVEKMKKNKKIRKKYCSHS